MEYFLNFLPPEPRLARAGSECEPLKMTHCPPLGARKKNRRERALEEERKKAYENLIVTRQPKPASAAAARVRYRDCLRK